MHNIKIYNIPKGPAFISGRQEFYISKDGTFLVGYRLNDTWSQN